MPRRARWYMGRLETSLPSKETLPPSGSIMPMVMRKLVVFPAPLRPRRPTISARSTWKETPATTVLPEKDFWRLWTWSRGTGEGREKEGTGHEALGIRGGKLRGLEIWSSAERGSGRALNAKSDCTSKDEVVVGHLLVDKEFHREALFPRSAALRFVSLQLQTSEFDTSKPDRSQFFTHFLHSLVRDRR